MALQIRRGLEAALPASPADGELLYATDTNKLYVGDGGVAQEISGGGGLANLSPKITLSVTIVAPQAPDTGNKYFINGEYKPQLKLQYGYTYVFNQSDDTNVYWPNANGTTPNPHNLNFSADNLNGANGGGTAFLTNVVYKLDNVVVTRAVYNGAGFITATQRSVEITVANNFPTTLYYWCYNHLNMGSSISFVNPRLSSLSDVVISGATTNQVLKYNGTNWVNGTDTGSANIVEDTTPQLGGNLDVNGFTIASAGNNPVNISAGGTGDLILQGLVTINDAGNILKTGELNITSNARISIGRNDTLTDGNLYITRNSYNNAFAQGFYFAQHHDNANAVNFNLYRTRGTAAARGNVQSGDKLAYINFTGYNNARIDGAVISVTVEGAPSLGRIPAKISFDTDNGTNLATRAELSSAGVWKVNNLENLSGSTLTLTATTVNVAGDMQLNARGDLRFADADSSNWVAFQAPATVSANVTWTLPAVDGTLGQVLSTNGTGTLSWTTASGGSGLVSRTAVSETTGILANGATGTISVTGAKGYVLYKIETSVAAWVRIYTSTAARTADSSRAEGVDPVPGAGVIAEVITTGAATIVMSPGVIGFNDEALATTAIALAVTNKSGSSSTVTVTLTILQIEA
jgi:hypothetical protein